MKKLIFLASFCFALLLLVLFNQSNIGTEQTNFAKNTLDSDIVQADGNYSYGISTSDKLAGEVAQQVLEDGGTAIDAAIALSYALGITEPYGSGIGGGGGMMIKQANEEPIFLDYREISDKTGEQRDDMIAIPSFVYAMDYISKHYGTLPIESLIQPSIEMANDGIPVSEELAFQLRQYKDWISGVYPEGYDLNNNPLEVGDTFKQRKVGKILENIVNKGPDSFYELLQKKMRHPLEFEIDEVKELAIKETEPLQANINGYTFYAPEAPFSGETTLQILSALEESETPSIWEGNIQNLVDTFKYTRNSYAHRFNHIGDPEHVAVPNGLTEEVLQDIMTNEDFEIIEDDEPVSTTHFSIIDEYGNVVSTTNTIGNFFGHKQNQLGFFFNSNLTIASKNSDSPNRLEPYKRSRTFMSPMILMNDEETIAIGTPGGSRIPEILAQVVQNYFANGDLTVAVEQPRISVLNDKVAFEDYIAPEISTQLEDNDYRVSVNTSLLFFGGINAIGKQDTNIFGVADERRHGILLISE